MRVRRTSVADGVRVAAVTGWASPPTLAPRAPGCASPPALTPKSPPCVPPFSRGEQPQGGGSARGRLARRRPAGFTLVELLVVIFIILIVSAVALPTILPALSHRQVSEAARLLQGALAGARDAALRDNEPSGIRLLPDPTFPLALPNSTVPVDPTLPLVYNRMIPLETAPEYSDGMVTPLINIGTLPAGFAFPFPCLLVKEVVVDPTLGLPQTPTSWFWNIRVGDKIQLNNSGIWYTVVGPMAITPAAGGNSEMFVNAGPPGAVPVFPYLYQDQEGPNFNTYNPEYLFLVNGLDDNANGWIDEGFDGVDNNGNGVVDEFNLTVNGVTVSEWETEAWPGALSTAGGTPMLYTIQRRPAPTANARETALPTNVVIDATTWQNSTPERSRLPVNSYTGYVDIIVNPNGSVDASVIYSTPTWFGMGASFFHFWLAERQDVYPPLAATAVATQTGPFLPLPQGFAPAPPAAGAFPGGGQINGEYRLVTLFSRTGQVTTNDNVTFDSLISALAQNRSFNVNLPYVLAQQGVRGGQ